VWLLIAVLYSPIFFEVIHVIREYRRSHRIELNLRRIATFFIISCLLSISFSLVLSEINFLDYKSPVPYSNHDQIKLSSFKGLNIFGRELDGSKEFAWIHTSIEWDLEEDSVYLESFFHPSRSYIYNEDAYDPSLLKHEIYHFKITEMFVRMAKKKIVEDKIGKDHEIDQMISNIKKLEKSYQDSYDNETYHGYIMNKQQDYIHEIDSTLNSLKKYKDNRIKLP